MATPAVAWSVCFCLPKVLGLPRPFLGFRGRFRLAVFVFHIFVHSPCPSFLPRYRNLSHVPPMYPTGARARLV